MRISTIILKILRKPANFREVQIMIQLSVGNLVSLNKCLITESQLVINHCQGFSDFFRGYKNGTMILNGLRTTFE